MSLDIYPVLEVGLVIIAIAIQALGAARGFLIGRASVGIYRSRANWSVALLVFVIISNLGNYATFSSDIVGQFLSFLPFASLLVVILAFLNNTLAVARDSDFFHRDALHWKQLGKAFYIVLAVSLAISFVTNVLNPALFQSGPTDSTPFILNFLDFYQEVAVVIAVFGLALVAVILGASRTPDRVLRGHIRLLGLALGTFVVQLLTFPLPSSDALQVLSELISLVGAYLLYRAVMSLTSVGRLDPALAGEQRPTVHVGS